MERKTRSNTDKTNLPWEKRRIDPLIQMVWVAEMRVEPANKAKGRLFGFTNYADGRRQLFELK